MNGGVQPDLGEEESRAVRQSFRHVPAEPPPGERADSAGICPFSGQTPLAPASRCCGRVTGLLSGARGTASEPLAP